MNMVILFNKPILLATARRNGIRKITEIFGYQLPPDTDLNLDDEEDFIDYLCTSSKWIMDGNSVNGYAFIDDQINEVYDYSDEEIEDYRSARRDMNLTYTIYATDKYLEKDNPAMWNVSFIRSRKLCDSIREYAATVDVHRGHKSTNTLKLGLV